MSKSLVTAADVRAYFRGNESRMARLAPEAAKTVADGARGRLHPQAVKVFNAKRKADRRYTLGATKTATAQAQATAKARREAAAAAGIAVGKRGPLPKAAAAVLAVSKG